MNKYIVNIYGDQNVEIIANKVNYIGGNLCFFRDDVSVAEFTKWQYWKLEGKFVEPNVPVRIKF